MSSTRTIHPVQIFKLEASKEHAVSHAPWYKDAIIYELHVRSFYDSNGDGMGDFKGLTERLDYLQDLGVNAIWLLPFYPSPWRDDGYDIADYRRSPGLRDRARLQAVPEGGARARPPGYHRARHQPYLQPAPLVRASPKREAGQQVTATSTSGARRRIASPKRGSSFRTSRHRTGPGTRSPARITGTGSSRTSRT